MTSSPAQPSTWSYEHAYKPCCAGARCAGASAPDKQSRFEIGPLRIDTATHAASLHGDRVALRRLEFELLLHLASDPQRVFHKQELLNSVWGYRTTATTRTLDSHASRLRCKLRAAGEGWIVNVWGIGYRLK